MLKQSGLGVYSPEGRALQRGGEGALCNAKVATRLTVVLKSRDVGRGPAGRSAGAACRAFASMPIGENSQGWLCDLRRQATRTAWRLIAGTAALASSGRAGSGAAMPWPSPPAGPRRTKRTSGSTSNDTFPWSKLVNHAYFVGLPCTCLGYEDNFVSFAAAAA